MKHIMIRVDDELHYKVKYISLVRKTSIQKIVETLLRELVQRESTENDTFTEQRRETLK
ncbi:MAG: hypothetical protein Q4F18_11115 [Clostridia bacterium]|nr:hypothetical protein [Clostridia bacterium]